MGNIRLSYSDSNGDGVVAISELIEESNYYPFGLKHKGYNNVTNGTENRLLTFNGVELEESLDLNMYEMDVRSYDPAIGRFTTLDPIIHHSVSPYTGMDNNPVFWADPIGANSVQDLIDQAIPGVKYTSNGDGTFSGEGHTIGEKTESSEESSETESNENEPTFDTVGSNTSTGNSNVTNNNQNSKNLRQDCPKCPKLDAFELQGYWDVGMNVVYTTDGKGNYRYYYKDGGIEETTTSPTQKMLQDLTGLWLINSIGKVFKYFSAAKSSSGIVFKSTDDLIEAAGKLSRGKSGSIGSVKGNADDIFNSLTRGATKLESGAFKLNNGTILNLHRSTTTKFPTISINQGGKITKIRIAQ